MICNGRFDIISLAKSFNSNADVVIWICYLHTMHCGSISFYLYLLMSYYNLFSRFFNTYMFKIYGKHLMKHKKNSLNKSLNLHACLVIIIVPSKMTVQCTQVPQSEVSHRFVVVKTSKDRRGLV